MTLGTTVAVDDVALRQGLSLAVGDAQLPFGHHAGGIVDDERNLVAGRYAERDRVGAECAARTAVRRGAAAPGLAPADRNDADAAGPRRLLRVLAQPADVPGAHQARAADRRAARLVDGQRHGPARRVVAEAVVAVDQQGGGGLRQDRRFGVHFQVAAFRLPQVLRNTQHPVGVVSGEVGADQNPCHLVRDGVRGARSPESPPRDRVQMTGRESMHRRTIRPGPLAVKVAHPSR